MENKLHNVIPVLRIFDIAKAKEFYTDALAMQVTDPFSKNLHFSQSLPVQPDGK